MAKSINNYYNRRSVYKTRNRRKRIIVKLLKTHTLDNKNILDVGCGEGSLGKALKENGANVTGIDISKKAIEIAKKKIDKVFLLDVENDHLPFKRGEFDIIILSEIIEHIFSPTDLLNKIKPFLKQGGYLILTVPNFLYFSNRIKMLFGKFNYTNGGILDFGHIRFFTYKQARELIMRNNFKITKQDYIVNYKLSHGVFKIPLRILRKLKVLIAKILPGLFAFQFVIKAKKLDE